MTHLSPVSQQRVYGTSLDALRRQVELNLLTYHNTRTVAMSLLSDAQECIANGDGERARQVINCAKWVLSEYER